MFDSNMWQRPRLYGRMQDEAMAVRNAVGIIDVSTLGKLDVRGRDAPALLDRLYTHSFSTLRNGRVRYGVLCADNGTIMDDGTVTRLAEDRYFVTTSTASVEAIEEWFKWWMAGGDACAYVTNVTSGYGVINVAGPRGRETLAKLTDVDLSSKAFRYMRAREGSVAGVPTLMLRIGFVGETGWELHFPAEYGEHMWDALMEAGSEFGISPFGTETQRVLRLEKMHIIPNQDTDMVSNPLDAGMKWVVRMDKDDFIGRGGLAAAMERPAKSLLVGFVMQNGAVPHDGDAVVADMAPVGRVTSSRLSPTMGKGFGYCWVPADLAERGTTIHIRTDGVVSPAEVRTEPFYDPEGKRLRAVAMAATRPLALSALHHVHLSLGAAMEESYGWLRPARYTSPDEESRGGATAGAACATRAHRASCCSTGISTGISWRGCSKAAPRNRATPGSCSSLRTPASATSLPPG